MFRTFIVADDVTCAGKVELRKTGTGGGGHNGLRSVAQMLGTIRLRAASRRSRPATESEGATDDADRRELADHVLLPLRCGRDSGIEAAMPGWLMQAKPS